MNLRRFFSVLTTFERGLWLLSLAVICAAFFLAGRHDPLTLIASLVGVTALIFVAKGHVVGQVLTVVFSLLYAVISWGFRYYGEMITYLGMTAPIAVLSVVSWLRHPYQAGKPEVRVARLSSTKRVLMALLTIGVTGGFYFILAWFQTANLLVSTISIATSFLASYLMFFRSASYALAYAANDLVLIVLWVLASLEDAAYLSMVACFLVFFCNDLYGFYNWRKMHQRQNSRQ